MNVFEQLMIAAALVPAGLAALVAILVSGAERRARRHYGARHVAR